MAGPTVKEILVKWGIDTSSWKSAIQQLGKLLDDQNRKSAQANADAIKAFSTQVDSAEDLLAIRKKDTTELQKQTSLVTSLGKQYEAIVDTGWDQVAIEKAITAEIQKQILLRKTSGLESVKAGRITGGGATGKAARAAFDQQKIVGASIKGVIIDLQAEVVKFLSIEKLVTKELQKQQNIINTIRKQPAIGGRLPVLPKPRVVPTTASAAPYAIAIANLNAAKAKGHLSEEKERLEHAKIVALLDQEIKKKQLSAASTAKEVTELEKLTRLRANQAAQSKGERTGLGKTLEEFGAGTISRMMGTLGFAVFSAEGIGRIFESATEKLKEFIQEVGPLQQVREQFEKLATGAGINPTEFIDKLRGATHGLVADTELYRNANTFLQSGVKVSQEDIINLTQATVGLARAQGKDATQAVEALNQFFLTGYARTLSHVVGMQAAQISSLRGMGRQMGGTAANAMQFQQALEAITAQYKAIGEPAETYTEALKRMHNAQNRILEEFVLGMENSPGFKSIIGSMDELADKMNEIAEKAGAWGAKVGEVVAQVYQAFQSISQGVGGILSDLFAILLKDIHDLADLFGMGKDQADEFASRLTTLGGIAATLSETITILVGGVRELVTWLRFAGEAAPNLERGLIEAIPVLGKITSYFDRLTSKDGQTALEKLKHVFLAAQSREAGIAEDVDRGLNKSERLRAGGQKPDYRLTGAVPSFRVSEEQEIEAEKRLAKVKEEIAIQVAKLQYEQAENRIKKETFLNQIFYEEGLRSFDEYMANRRRLEDEDYNARKKQNDSEFKAKQEFLVKDTELQRAQASLQRAQVEQAHAADLKALQDEEKKKAEQVNQDVLQGKTPVADIPEISKQMTAQFNAQKTLIENNYKAGLKVADAMDAEINAKSTLNQAERNSKNEALEVEHQNRTLGLTKEEVEKQMAVRESAAKAILGLDKSRIANAKEFVENEFKDGLTTADAYLTARKALIEQEYQAAKDAADKEFEYAKDKVIGKQTQDNQYLAAAEAREKAYTDMQLKQLDTRTEAAERAANRIKSVLEAQLAQQESVAKINPWQARQGEVQIVNALIEAEKYRLNVLKQQADLQTQEPEQQAKTRVEIEKTEQSLQGYRDKLIEISDMSKDLASEARNMATAASLFPKGSKTAQGLEKYAQITETIGKLNEDFLKSLNAQRSGQTRPLTPEEVYAALMKTSDVAADSLDIFSSGLTNATQVVAQFAAVVQGKLTGSAPTAIGGKASGGPIDVTGLYTMHAGEYVLPTSMAGVFNAFIKALDEFTKEIVPKTAALKPGAIATPVRPSPTAPVGQPNILKEFLLALQNFGRVIVGKKPILQRPIETHGTHPPGKTTVRTPAAVRPKADTTVLETSLKSLTDAISKLTDHLTGADQPTGPSGPAGSKAPVQDEGFNPFTQSSGPSPGGISGLPTPQSPQGVLTDSDKQSLTANLSSGLGNAQGASDSLTNLASSAQSASAALSGVADSGTQAQTAKDASAGAGSDDQSGAGGLQQQLGTLTKGLSSIMGTVGGIMQTFKTTGAFQGAAAGAASFGQAGQMIGSFAGPLGGMIGGAIGSVVGGIAGAISGAMREATQRMADRLTAAFNAVIQEVQSGNQTLGAGISLSIQQIQATVTALSGRKGGRDDLKQILPGMEQQLAQLQAQQEQVLKSMDQQVSALNAPLAYQGQLGSIQTIISAYQQYIQAGGNVVTANQYLQDSFQNLVTQGMQQLNQDEQDAVNNALNYNNLLLQRQELIQNTNSQIQSIMSQGVAVRQMPEGVTKAIQIQQLMLNNTQQMDQLNQQISVSQYQLTVQQKIFGLATTRIGLENQLVILQNEQTNYSMQQIQALGEVVGAFSTKLPTSMQAAEQQLGFGGAFVNPGTEPGLMPVPPVKTGVSQIDLQNQLQYQQALAAWQLSQNFPIGYIPTSGNVSTTPVPTTIGNPSVYSGSGGPLNENWLTPGQTSILGTAQGAATSFNTALNAFGQLPSNVMGSLGTAGLTINGTQVSTVGTASGTALLVAPETSNGPLTVVPIITGPGTIQSAGIIGTAAQAGSATSSLFDSLSGASNTLIQATTGRAAPTAAEAVQSPGTGTTSSSALQANIVSTPAGLALLVSTVTEAMNGVAGIGTSTTKAPTTATSGVTTVSSGAGGTGFPATAGTSFPATAGTSFPATAGTSFPATAGAGVTGASIIGALAGSVTMSLLPQPQAPQFPVVSGPTSITQAPVVTPVAQQAQTSPLVTQAVASQAQAANTLVTNSLQRVAAETTISQLSTSRVAAESALVNLKMTEIQADMQRVQMHNDLLTRVQNWSSGNNSIENSLQALYEQRGRQGFGSFYGEISNPT